MASNNAIKVSEFDYSNLRTSLKEFLQQQNIFSDYDFDGSAMSIILDVLAADTYQKAFALNMVHSETFIDTAQLRHSVVSRAKELDYTPRSARAASAVVQVTITPDDLPPFITIPKGTRIRGTMDGNRYVFSTREAVTVNPTGGLYRANITFYEGDPTVQTHLVPSYDDTYIVPINNENIDTETLKIYWRASAGSTNRVEWRKSTNILSVTGSSEVFFLEENLNGLYQVQFGDGVIGKKPVAGNILEISYNVVNNVEPNGLIAFSEIDTMGSYSTFTLTTIQGARGGQERESIESVRFNAPKSFISQNRAVTENDYQQFVLNNFGDIQALAVWGGEENEIPQYGKVFLSVKPFDGFTIADTRKEDIKRLLETVNIFSIDPVFVDPTFIYIVPTLEVKYDNNLTSLQASAILELVKNKISSFENSNLGTFNRNFKFSKFTTAIDNSDSSIQSNETYIKLQKRFLPILNSEFTYSLNFHQEIYHPFAGYDKSLSSNGFKLPGYSQTIYLDEDGNGNIRAYYFSIGNKKVYVNNNIGNIDYRTGVVKLSNFNPTSLLESELHITVVPTSRDVSPIRNEILLITGSVIRIYNSNTGELITTGSSLTIGDETSLEEQPFLTGGFSF